MKGMITNQMLKYTWIIGSQVKETKVKTMTKYNREGQHVQARNYNRDNKYNQKNYETKNDWVGPYVPLQNRESSPKEVRGNISCIQDMTQKMMRRFDVTYENVKEM